MLNIPELAFPYLVRQRGGIYELRANRETWELAYQRQLEEQVFSILPHLNGTHCGRDAHILDVGSGLGGVDMLLSRALAGARVTLLDGVMDPPLVKLHRETFNDMAAAALFWAANGEGPQLYSYVDPRTRIERPFDAPEPLLQTQFNLVVSFGSYCFHYPPEEYLCWIEQRLARHAVLVFEVRNGKREWVRHLENVLGRSEVLAESRKYTRLLFRRP